MTTLAGLGAPAEPGAVEDFSQKLDQVSEIRGVVTWGPQIAWGPNPEGAMTPHFARVVVWDPEHRASRAVMFPPALAPWAAANLATGSSLDLSSALSRPTSPHEGRPWELWAQGVRSTDANEPLRCSTPPPSKEELYAAFAPDRVTLKPARRDAPKSFQAAIAEETVFVEIPEKLASAAQKALADAPGFIHDAGLRQGVEAKLPLSLCDEVLRWCGENQIPANFSRAQKYAAIMPDRDATNALAGHGIRADVVNSACFRGALRANDSGAVFALQRGPQGPCGIARVDKRLGDRVVAGHAGLWVSNPVGKDQKLVIVATPLEALAYHQTRPATNVRYVAASGGNLQDDQRAALRSLLHAVTSNNSGRTPDIVVATGHDLSSQRFTRQVMDVCEGRVPRREVPPFGDSWLAHADMLSRGRSPQVASRTALPRF